MYKYVNVALERVYLVIPFLTNVVELQCNFSMTSLVPIPDASVAAFSELLQTSLGLETLGLDVEQNHTLLTVMCSGHLDADVAGHWHTVQETTRRNSSVVARAALLLKASPLDRYVSGALQRVMRHPALLTEVAELVKMDKAELVNLIRDRLRGLETLDGFMKLAGVVKERVVCHASDDGCTQLDALNEDCWRHVRQYLFIDDVKEGIAQTEKL
ncbi:hypothetical protein HPB52_009330 [Rhipicephalus sanguineus]|uniref:Uncharacterized protein n=1 Tax=Rhipicephalus sanguineus TaxID=34632 RepID=A0A9D4QEG7_RHISA|nr:hypothetical protein HPB52_009330 [Rhipicephalus sanguineus]